MTYPPYKKASLLKDIETTKTAARSTNIDDTQCCMECERLNKEIGALKAENERLRAALDKIATPRLTTFESNKECHRHFAIAREALEKK